MSEYQLKPLSAPAAQGIFIRILTWLAESVPFLSAYIAADTGLMRFRKRHITEPPTYYPFDIQTWVQVSAQKTRVVGNEIILKQERASQVFRSSQEYVDQYMDGTSDPVATVEAILEWIEQDLQRERPIQPMLYYSKEEALKQAKESAERYKKGRPLGPLDGVPVTIKDEMDVLPYPTSAGTNYIKDYPERDATCVERLRKAGAIIIGKVKMHEFGTDVTNINPMTGTPRNPYHPDHVTGGSSGGSAASVACGLVPISIGADGGGSIRVPASLCGLFGLKPTAGRISTAGGYPNVDPTCGVFGPITGTSKDLAITYLAIAGPDPKDTQSLLQPPVTVDGYDQFKNLKDVKIGVYWPFFNDCDAQVVEKAKQCLKKLEALGAKVIEVHLGDLEDFRQAHAITITSEIYSATGHLPRHKSSWANRMLFQVISNVQADDYLQAAKIKTRAMNVVRGVFGQVDVIMTPTTAITAPEIPAGALKYGRSDYNASGRIMQYITLANFTGIPAVTCPVGLDDKGLPVGVQFQAKWWNEALLLRMAHTVEHLHKETRPKPIVFTE
ncbi:Asp-tRNAAsn/Glu-tRNAGln amidotransferase A subunit and related amidase [Gorgonomyces haynaldii]|nr:Asp-tRNAAsn/Glu-tRNAGln amidotransferase A subunit and related amidase [Gorgonomyces haynaldii]